MFLKSFLSLFILMSCDVWAASAPEPYGHSTRGRVTSKTLPQKRDPQKGERDKKKKLEAPSLPKTKPGRSASTASRPKTTEKKLNPGPSSAPAVLSPLATAAQLKRAPSLGPSKIARQGTKTSVLSSVETPTPPVGRPLTATPSGPMVAATMEIAPVSLQSKPALTRQGSRFPALTINQGQPSAPSISTATKTAFALSSPSSSVSSSASPTSLLLVASPVSSPTVLTSLAVSGAVEPVRRPTPSSADGEADTESRPVPARAPSPSIKDRFASLFTRRPSTAASAPQIGAQTSSDGILTILKRRLSGAPDQLLQAQQRAEAETQRANAEAQRAARLEEEAKHERAEREKAEALAQQQQQQLEEERKRREAERTTEQAKLAQLEAFKKDAEREKEREKASPARSRRTIAAPTKTAAGRNVSPQKLPYRKLPPSDAAGKSVREQVDALKAEAQAKGKELEKERENKALLQQEKERLEAETRREREEKERALEQARQAEQEKQKAADQLKQAEKEKERLKQEVEQTKNMPAVRKAQKEADKEAEKQAKAAEKEAQKLAKQKEKEEKERQAREREQAQLEAEKKRAAEERERKASIERQTQARIAELHAQTIDAFEATKSEIRVFFSTLAGSYFDPGRLPNKVKHALSSAIKTAESSFNTLNQVYQTNQTIVDTLGSAKELNERDLKKLAYARTLLADRTSPESVYLKREKQRKIYRDLLAMSGRFNKNEPYHAKYPAHLDKFRIKDSKDSSLLDTDLDPYLKRLFYTES